MKIQVIFYSMYGHIYRLAEAVASGAREVDGAEVSVFQVAERIPDESLQRSGAATARATFAHIPAAATDRLAEAVGIIFCAPRCAISYSEQRLSAMAEITGGSPYGAATVTGSDGSRKPSENELTIVRFQGRHVAQIAKK